MSSSSTKTTICALASGAPPAGIAVIRISGPQVKAFSAAQLKGGLPQPHMARLRKFVDRSGEMVDEVLTLFMPSGASYTNEDVLELHLHGGSAIVDHALETLLAFPGIGLAEPGEFTRRAFEAGRLDLTQAEGIADLIEAETRAQKAQALAQTDGALTQIYSAWRASLLKAMSLLEVSVDFPDESEAPETVQKPVLEILLSLESELENALRDGKLHQSVRDGFKVAIIGAPNAGKSTLLNRLAGRDAAIVTNVPGTTRDIIEVRTRLAGQVIWFQDTAGLRQTDDPVEMEGVTRAKAAGEKADLRIFLFADDAPLSPTLEGFPARRAHDLLVRNKADLRVNERLKPDQLEISAETGTGIDSLVAALETWLGEIMGDISAPIITRTRHRIGIEKALASTRAAISLVKSNAGAELASEDVRLAARALAALVGEIGVEEILGAVFSEFCIGK